MRNGQILKLTVSIVVALFMLNGDAASAVNGWDMPLNTTTNTTSQTNASVQLTMGGKKAQETLDAAKASTNPDEAGKVLTEVATIVVGSTDGYTVAVSGNVNLTGEKNSNHKIPSVTSAKTLGSMKNEWGYYGVLGDAEASWNPGTSFKGMSTNQQTVATGGATSSNVTKKVTLFYGARVDNTIAEDFYGNTVTLSVVAQPRTVTNTVATFGGITTMQDLTPSRCSAAKENDTAYLRDTRDGNYYWVTKLKDGNCWMSQNLALYLSTSKALTSADSDVVNNWTPGQTTTDSVRIGSVNNRETYSWNLGSYIIADPASTTLCPSSDAGPSACPDQFIAVGNRTPSTNPNFYRDHGNKTYTSTEYDAHYLAGNYYQWNTATVGTGGTIVNVNASGSICPKNWKLPNSNSATKNSFSYLLQQYGVSDSLQGVSGGDNYNIVLSPLFFVRGGVISPGVHFSDAGQYGYYWSSRAWSDTSSAYNLRFDGYGVNPSVYNNRYYGHSLRCLVPTT